MNDPRALWWNRCRLFWQHALKYLKIILTGYAYLPMIFLLLLGLLYQYLLKTLPGDFPVSWLLASVFTLILNHSSVRTFLKKADTVFLLPLESKLKLYFLHSYIYSYLLQIFWLVLILFLLAPLYTVRVSPDTMRFYWVLLGMAALKGLNLFIAWQEQKWIDKSGSRTPVLLRYVHNIYWSLVLVDIVTPWWTALIFSALVSLIIVKRARKIGYPWLRLIEMEEQHKSAFYSFAGWFMEIPELSRKVSKRTALLVLFRWIPHHPRWAYTFLFVRSFIRYSDLFYGYFRLTLIAIFILLFLNQVYISAIVCAICLLFTSIQMANGWSKTKHLFWYQIHPLPSGSGRRGYIQTAGLLLTLQAMILFTVCLCQYPLMTALFLFITSLFAVALIIVAILPRVIKDI